MDQIRERLDDRFRLLTGGSRTAMARHQTLQAAIEWSYDQLMPGEQRLLRLVAVFSGGWTLDVLSRLAEKGPTSSNFSTSSRGSWTSRW